jgi:hypothetical protein
MRATLFYFIGSAAAAAIALVPVTRADAAGVMTARESRVLAVSAPVAAAPGDPSTSVTFTVTSGALTMTVPATADLGSGGPGTTIGPTAIGPCTVTDDRALSAASWTVTASETDFANQTDGAAPVIPATDATYAPGTITTTGTITATGTDISLTNATQTVVTGSAGVGDNTATWSPSVGVAVPPAAVGGLYQGTLTQSVA